VKDVMQEAAAEGLGLSLTSNKRACDLGLVVPQCDELQCSHTVSVDIVEATSTY